MVGPSEKDVDTGEARMKKIFASDLQVRNLSS